MRVRCLGDCCCCRVIAALREGRCVFVFMVFICVHYVCVFINSGNSIVSFSFYIVTTPFKKKLTQHEFDLGFVFIMLDIPGKPVYFPFD